MKILPVFLIFLLLSSLSLTAQQNYSIKELEQYCVNSVAEYNALVDSVNKNGGIIKDTLDKEWFMMSGSTVYRVSASFARSKPSWVCYKTYSAIASKSYARILASEAIELGYKPVSNDTTANGSRRDLVQRLSAADYELTILEKQYGSTDNMGNFRLTTRSYSEFAVIVQRKK